MSVDHAATLQTGHVGINVTDLARSTTFYTHVLGLEVLRREGEGQRAYAFLGTGGSLLLTLWQQSSASYDPARSGLHHLSFAVPDMEAVRAARARLHESGGDVLHGGIVPHAEGADSGGIFFTDPDGTRLEIFSATGAAGTHAPTDGPTCGFF